MMTSDDAAESGAPPIIGVIEGFYGPPWSIQDRLEGLDFIGGHGGNWYAWAPKAAPRHRDEWKQPFTADEIDEFAALARRHPGVSVSIGLTPGSDATPQGVIDKLAPAVTAGVHGITLCFDDLPVLDAASRHRDLANAARRAFQKPTWVVPTHYAGTTTSPYLADLLDGLDEEILVMWTGPHVVADRIDAADARARRSVTNGRPPLVWDNTPVNDALMSEALHLGPYTGRDPALRTHVAGVLVNPMQFARASRPTIASALAWCQGRDHLAAWRTVVDSLGLRILAEATAFPDDPHWPGARPTAEWWTSVANIDPELALAAVESDIRPWVDAARDGARLALAALSADIDPDRSTRARFGLAWQWREWSRRPVLTFGRGPRLRPVAANDTSGRFVADPRSFDLSTSLVDDLVLRALRTG